MTESNTSIAEWPAFETGGDVRVIPTNRVSFPVRHDIQPPTDLVDDSKMLPHRESSASVDEYYLNFLLPDRSSNVSSQSQAGPIAILTRIICQQVERLDNEIDRSLANIRYGDDEMRQEAERHLALLISVLGEPGLYGTKKALDIRPAEDDDCDTLIQAIARAANRESLSDVVSIMSEYLSADDARMRYSAAEALARVGSEDARRVLRQALKDENNLSVKRLLEAALRDR